MEGINKQFPARRNHRTWAVRCMLFSRGGFENRSEMTSIESHSILFSNVTPEELEQSL